MGKVLLTDHPWVGTDIEADGLAAAGHELVEAPPGATEADLVALAADVVGIITCWAPTTEAVIAASPDLRVITRLGVGLDNIDVPAAQARGVAVTRVPDYCVDEVASHVVALTLAWARGVVFFDAEVHAGRWVGSARTLRRVKDLTVGIWGHGRIGRDAAAKFVGMGCTVLADDRRPDRVAPPVAAVPVDELLARSDVVCTLLPLSDATRGIVGAEVLARMRSDALLVNCSRGGLVDIDALVAALRSGTIGAAALDVLPDEPNVPPALLELPNVILTPHVAYSSEAAITELRQRATADTVGILAGQPPQHPVGPIAG